MKALAFIRFVFFEACKEGGKFLALLVCGLLIISFMVGLMTHPFIGGGVSLAGGLVYWLVKCWFIFKGEYDS